MGKRWVRALAGAGALALALAGGVLFWPLDPVPYLDVNPSGEMTDRDGRLLDAFLNADEQWCFERELDEIGPRMATAAIAVEDQRFYRHWGVDPVAVVRASWQNLRGRRVASGASTITMQVVKQADPASDSAKAASHPPRSKMNTRSIPGKAAQAVLALRLERHASKDAILRAYLNGAPYGMNLVGCEAAARRYFGKPARELTLAEAALLAGLPKSPTGLMPLRHGEAALERRNYVLDRMLAEGMISEAEHAEACAAPLGAKWHEFPALAPHLAMLLRDRIAAEGRVQVALDAQLQASVEQCVARALDRFGADITNAGVMVVDVPSAALLARVGSGDFWNTPGGGQVDVCRAPRSPGSALKPFAYALAMERNRLYACESLHDGALDYGLYRPENYDGGYNGLISAGDALRHSLNVPAILVLNRIGIDAFDRFLRDAGLTSLRRIGEDYGLGLTIGNCEARLDELAAAYCMLANLGEYRPLRFDCGAEPHGRRGVAHAARLLSRGVCLKVYDMLEQPLPGEFEDNVVNAVGVRPRICLKTGTSTGHHDAWAFIFNAQYLVGVWLGNNDGRASMRLVGASSALPLAARVFRSLPSSNASFWPVPGGDLRPVRVCAVSGLPASEWCMRARMEQLPREQYLHRVCDVHYPGIRENTPTIEEHWPGSAKGWDLADIAAPRARGIADAEETARRVQGLRILDPPDRAEFVLTGEPDGDRIALRTSLDAEGPLHWYLDDRYLGMSAPGRPCRLDLTEGDHTLACMDNAGTVDKVVFAVNSPEGHIRFASR